MEGGDNRVPGSLAHAMVTREDPHSTKEDWKNQQLTLYFDITYTRQAGFSYTWICTHEHVQILITIHRHTHAHEHTHKMNHIFEGKIQMKILRFSNFNEAVILGMFIFRITYVFFCCCCWYNWTFLFVGLWIQYEIIKSSWVSFTSATFSKWKTNKLSQTWLWCWLKTLLNSYLSLFTKILKIHSKVPVRVT